jgi:hypothetical protein
MAAQRTALRRCVVNGKTAAVSSLLTGCSRLRSRCAKCCMHAQEQVATSWNTSRKPQRITSMTSAVYAPMAFCETFMTSRSICTEMKYISVFRCSTVHDTWPCCSAPTRCFELETFKSFRICVKWTIHSASMLLATGGVSSLVMTLLGLISKDKRKDVSGHSMLETMLLLYLHSL